MVADDEDVAAGVEEAEMLSNSVIASCMARSSCEFSLRLLCGRMVSVYMWLSFWLVSGWVRIWVFHFRVGLLLVMMMMMIMHTHTELYTLGLAGHGLIFGFGSAHFKKKKQEY